MRTRLALGWIALTMARAPTLAAPELPPAPPRAVTRCDDDGCDLTVPMVEVVEVCVELPLSSQPFLQLSDRRSLPMVRNEDRWCAAARPRDMEALVDGKRTRPLRVTFSGASGPGESVTPERWAEVDPKGSGEAALVRLAESQGMLPREGESALKRGIAPELLGVPSRYGDYAAHKEDIERDLRGGGARRGTGNLVATGKVDKATKGKEPVPEKPREPVPDRPPPPPPPPSRHASPFETAGSPPDDTTFFDVVLVGAAGGYHCSGILVAPDAVLTAGHCAPATLISLGNRKNRVLVHIAVKEALAHPSLDAALLMLEREAPVPLRPRRRGIDAAPPTGVMRMVGFGVDDPRYASSFGVKRRVDAMVLGWGCDEGRARPTGCLVGRELAIAGVGGRDTCMGDSGGPVLEPFHETLRLVAITSRPVRDGGAPCGRGGVYVRVDVLDPWLTSSLEKNR